VTTTATAASHVSGNPYSITASGAVAANYTISYVAGTLTVTPVALIVTADNKTKVYGAALPTLTASYSGFVNGDTATSLATPPAITTTATASSHVSGNPYSISASGAVDSDYSISYVAGTLTVTPAALTITADDKPKAYGAALPIFTASYSGFVNGDSSASLTTQPTFSTTATAASHVSGNPHSITASGAVDTDYTISYAPGTLTVTPVALTITPNNQSKVYGAALPTLTVSYSGLVNGDTAASLTTPPTVTTTATAASPVSTYPISASGAVDADYVIGYGSGTLTVTTAGLTITANNQSKAYGAALPSFTVSYSGFVAGDTAASLTTPPTVTTTASAGSPVNTYPITANGAVDANYTITYVAGTLTVNPVALTITANSRTKTYGETVSFAGTEFASSGLVNGDTIASVTLNSAGAVATAGVGASPYNIVPSAAAGTGLENYTIGYANGTLTVNPATVTAIPTVLDKVYDGTNTATPNFAAGSAAFTGVLNGDHINLAQDAGSTATFADRKVGTGKLVTVTNLKITGPDKDNYSLSSTTATTTANITPAPLSITAVTNTKPYDGNTTAAAIPTVSVLQDGDTVTGRVEAYVSASAGTGKILTVTAYTINDGNSGLNYTVTKVDNTTGVITAAALAITADPQTKVYGSADPTLTYHVSGLQLGDTASTVLSGALARATGENVATSPYAITQGTLVANGNYTINFIGNALSITPATLTVTANHQTKVYGQSDPALTFASSGFQFSDTAASVLTGSLTRAAGEHVSGSPYAISQGTLAANSNYTIAFTGNSLAITPAALTVTANNQTKAYGAALPALTVSYLGFVNGDTAASLTTPPTVTTTATASSHVSGNPYSITVSGAVDIDYTISYVAGTLTVTPVGLTITADNQTKAYGAALPALTVSYSGFVNGDTSASLTTQPTVVTTATAASHVSGNPYGITASGAVDSDYTIGYVAGTLTVTPVGLTITADNQTKAYGAALPTLTVSYSGFVNGDTSASLTTQPTAVTTATSTSHVSGNPYSITASGAVDNDYTIGYLAGTLTVTPVSLTITADNQTKAYGAALPTLTVSYSGFVNGDTSASLTTQPAVLTTATATSHVSGNPYSITASGAVDNDYSIGYVAGTLTVTPVSLTITADNQTKAYGAALPPLTVSYSGFVNGDTSASLTTQPAVVTTATASSHVSGNAYSITASGAVDTDYTIGYASGALTVTPVSLTITANNQTKAYGAALPALTVSYLGFVNGDTAASLTTPPTVTTTATASSHVSGNPYSITASGAVDTDYTIGYVAGTLTVTPVGLTITADNQTKAYGAALPSLTVSYVGLVNGDTPAELTTQPNVTTTATTASHVSGNPYSITASGAVDSDYTIGYVDGTLTVTPVGLTITADNQTKAYGAALPALTVSYLGFVNGDTSASLTTPPTVTTTATASSHVSGNPYSITASGAVDTDYTIGYVAGTLTVTPVGLTITANNKSKAYGAALPTLTVSYAGFVNGDTSANLTAQPTIVTSATAASHVSGNPYSITASGAVDTDYTIGYVDGTLTVTPVGLTITADNQTKAYGAALPPLTVSYSGFVNGDTSASLTTQPAVVTTATASSHVSGNPYSITASGAVDIDYTIGYVAGTLTVTPVGLTITADNQTKVYGTPLPTLTASYSGFVNGDTSANLTTQPTLSTTATTSSPVATYPITASGAVDADYMISYVAGTLTISKATTGTLVISSQNPTVFGTPITFTATVSDSSSGSAGAPSGMVTFKDGATTIGTPTLSGTGPTTATLKISSLSAGSHSITVVYGGDGNFVGSTSPALIQVVIPSVTATFLAPLAGQPVGNKIKVGQTVPHKVDVVNSLGQSVISGVTVKLQVQGMQVVNNVTTVFQDVVEDANGVGADGTAAGCGTMYFTGGHFQFNLDTGDFSDANTLAESNKYYTSTVTVIDNATSLVLGSTTINLETSSK
jgi:hypothetical protein